MSWSTNSWQRDDSSDRAGFDRGYLMGYHNAPVQQRQVYHLDDFRIGTTAVSMGLDPNNPTPPPVVVQQPLRPAEVSAEAASPTQINHSWEIGSGGSRAVTVVFAFGGTES